MTVLSFTAGLTGIFGILLNTFADHFLIGNLWCTHVCFHLELTQQTVNNDLQVQFAHTGDDGLACFFIGVFTERRVFFRQFCQSNAHFLLTGFGLRLNGNTNNRFRKFHGFQHNLCLFIAQRVAGDRVLHTYHSGNVSGIANINVFPIIGMHLQNTSETLFLLFDRVVRRFTRSDLTTVYAEKAEFSDIRIGHNLKCQRCKRTVVICRTFNFLTGIGICPLDGGNIQRRGHIINDGIQQLLYALVFIRRTASNRYKCVFNGSFSNTGFEILDGQIIVFQKLIQQCLVCFGNGFYQFLAVFLCQFLHIFRNRLNTHVLA